MNSYYKSHYYVTRKTAKPVVMKSLENYEISYAGALPRKLLLLSIVNRGKIYCVSTRGSYHKIQQGGKEWHYLE